MKERWILVTGSARHLGRAIALRLAQEQFSILVHYRTSETEAQQTAEACRAFGVAAHLLQGDLSTVGGAAALAQAATNDVGSIYGLVNNVGNYVRSSALNTPMNTAQELFAVNVFAPMMLIQEMAPLICASHGAIVNIGTSGMHNGRADSYASWYKASKEALFCMTRSLAKELSPHQVRVNMVSPGQMSFSVDLARYADQLPFKRAATAEEVADAVAFLIRQEYVTGQNLEVAGGFGL